MGSDYHITIAHVALDGPALEHLKAAIDARLREVNRQMSHYQPDSELSRFNAAPQGVPFRVSADFARVTRFALDLWQRSDGVFDPTLGPLIELWGFGPAGERADPPAPGEIETAQQRCGARHLHVTPQDELIKDIPGLALNLSALAAGFGADMAAAVLRQHRVDNYLVDINGEIVARGRNGHGQPWHVALESPFSTDAVGAALDCYVELDNQALATSGNYRKYFTDDAGNRFTHILDPRNGRPVAWVPMGVSAVAATGLEADGLATTLFVLGPQAGRTWLERACPGRSALFLEATADGRIRRLPTVGFPTVRDLPQTRSDLKRGAQKDLQDAQTQFPSFSFSSLPSVGRTEGNEGNREQRRGI
jgi:thiamine biosynthesis lipoprotein